MKLLFFFFLIFFSSGVLGILPNSSHYLSISHIRRPVALSVTSYYILVDVSVNLNGPLYSSVCTLEMALF